LLREEVGHLQEQADYYLFHEHLEDINQPLYFHEFARRAAAKGLQYLEEARFGTLPGSVPAEVRDVVGRISDDLIQREQYLDFLRGRAFRRPLLCHAGVPLRRDLTELTLDGFHLTTAVSPVSPAQDVASAAPEEFRTPAGVGLTTNNPL